MADQFNSRNYDRSLQIQGKIKKKKKKKRIALFQDKKLISIRASI